MKNNITKQSTIWKVIPLILLFIGLYYQIIFYMVKDWYNDSNYSHGFLIPFISAYIIWKDKEKISKIKIKEDSLGFLIILVGLVLYILGITGAEFFTMRFSMIPVMLGIVYCLCGREMAKSVLAPVGFLVCMIPIPSILFNVVAFPLKLFAANIATNVIQFLSIPVVRDGNIIHLTDMTLEVADACSGIRSLMSMIALGVAYAYLFQNNVIKRLILVLFIVPITITANVARVTGTGILSHYVGPAAAQGFFHEFAGIFIFMVAFAMFISVAAILNIWKTES
ncbi:MAG: exosortase/archaeosortase family protein [Candidatus Brocadiaceae bacterium]|nr:exosortase/archaeosortase family protein [Candidatus Brocadiaceae bacterium]